MNRIDRLVAIILLLHSRKVIRARDIADHFDISTRTVYRDMNALCEAGVPVAAEAGEGYSLVDGYHLPPVMFTAEEASALFIGAKFVENLTDASVRKQAESALLKIQSVLPDSTQEFLERLRTHTALFPTQKASANGFRDDILTTIQDAIVHRHVLALEYYAVYRDAHSSRDIEPLGLLYYSNHWHLIAFCRLRQDYRDFRTDRIKAIRIKDDMFAPRDGFSLQTYLQQFDALKDPIEVKIKFDKRIAPLARERHSYGLIDEEADADGIIFTYLTGSLKWTVHWLISYSTFVEIISPDSLRSAMQTEVQKLAAHYSSTATARD
ncbi:MAG: YafY family transcriptional regulator [Deferribacteres bacterium]|nr:YafY family transcriptional regulator [candidate division KSB1 bacterium]MCB9508803.1 YafY family transcriptional regulator [Deferribacteres bacterium]